jgi:ubiquitin thioesterase OTU1
MSTVAYQNYILDRSTWGGGLELRILSMIYQREIATFNIETARQHTFGEDQTPPFPKCIMVIYNGVHYDALAIAKSPRAKESDDITEFNPRTKRGKMIIAAAQKMVELKNRGAQFTSNSVMGSTKLRCDDCKKTFASEREAKSHAEKTSHTSFSQVK